VVVGEACLLCAAHVPAALLRPPLPPASASTRLGSVLACRHVPCLPAGGFGELPHQLAIVRADYTSQKYPQVGVPPGLPACPLTPAEFGLPSRQLGDVRTQQYT
jgi:hypothetical protein